MLDSDLLAPLRAAPASAGVFLDFDGTLAPIVARPELARPTPGAQEAVAALVPVFAVVAVITGRGSEDVARLLDVDGVRYVGMYGLEELGPQGTLDPASLVADAEAAAKRVPGVWVEMKGVSIAVHYRASADPAGARATIGPLLRDVAAGTGFEVIEGKMVLELVPIGESRKGGAVSRLVRETGVRAALFAGDDLADLEAFEALDSLAVSGLATVRVAVTGPETPPELIEAADLPVDGPPGLVELLRALR